VGRILAARDWSTHALGPPDGWPAGLGIALQIGLASRQPMIIWWGERLHQFHNDACLAILGDRHPACLAASAAQACPDLWETLGPPVRAALGGQRTTALARLRPDLVLPFSCIPLSGEAGHVDGVVGICREEDAAVRAEGLASGPVSRYREAFESAPCGTLVARLDGKALEANASACRLLDYDRNELEGKCLFDLFRPREALRLRRALRAGNEHRGECELRRRDGSFVWAALYWQVLPGGRWQVFVTDLSELAAERQAQADLRESEERYAFAARATREAIWDCDLATGQVRWNRAIADLLGWDEAVRGSTAQWWRARVHPDDRARVVESIEVAAATGQRSRWHAEYRFLRADGHYADIVDRGFIMRDAKGAALRMVGAMLDVTRTKRAEMALRDSEARYRTLIELSPQLLWIARPDGGFTFCNQRWVEYTGLSTAQSSERGWIAAVDPTHRSRVLQAWLQGTVAGAALEMEIPFRRAADGEYRWHLARAQPMRDSEENILHWMGIALDIHDRRQAAAALEDADRRKDEFLATLAHELRNPLAPLRNALYLLQLREHGVDAQPIHDIMDRQLRQLVRLVDDLLDVSRVTRGKIGLRRRIVDIASVVDAAVEAGRPLLDAGRHTFTVTLPEAPVHVDADPTRLAQVFTNLLNNAAKFTDPGGRVWLIAEPKKDELLVTVGDTGIGMPTQLLSEVFEMFRQLEHPLEHARGGLGIGLTLVKRLVQMHGGSVEAHSEGIGLGSRFVVRLPITEVPASTGGPAPDRRARSGRSVAGPVRHILVVDDNVDSAQSLALLLRRLGHDVRVAHDGESGLSAALMYQPRLVFLDLGLPGLSGHDIAQRLRARFEPGRMRLVAMTGYGHANDRLRSSAAGFDEHLVKPVEWSAIEATLATLGA
jgi:PAS domain S-box-containing protein